MDGSPFFQPGFLVPVAIATIGFIAWLIRLESKVNGTDKAVTRLETSVNEGWDALDQHRTNGNVHFNQQLAQQVEQRQSDRMGRMESDLKEIKDLVKGMASK